MSYQPNNRTLLLSLNSDHLQSNFSSKSLKHSIPFPKSSKHTRQEFAAECDINTIMARYIRTGEMPHINLRAPQYFDSSGVDFQTHMNAIGEAKSLFAELPSDIRNRFRNDPAQFIDFCGDPANRTELAHMGLLSPDATRSVLRPSSPSAPATKAPKTQPASAETPPAPASAPSADA